MKSTKTLWTIATYGLLLFAASVLFEMFGITTLAVLVGVWFAVACRHVNLRGRGGLDMAPEVYRLGAIVIAFVGCVWCAFNVNSFGDLILYYSNLPGPCDAGARWIVPAAQLAAFPMKCAVPRWLVHMHSGSSVFYATHAAIFLMWAAIGVWYQVGKARQDGYPAYSFLGPLLGVRAIVVALALGMFVWTAEAPDEHIEHTGYVVHNYRACPTFIDIGFVDDALNATAPLIGECPIEALIDVMQFQQSLARVFPAADIVFFGWAGLGVIYEFGRRARWRRFRQAQA